jgi:hypothetical protein
MGKITSTLSLVSCLIIIVGMPSILIGAWILKWLSVTYFIHLFSNDEIRNLIIILPYWGFYLPMFLAICVIFSLFQTHTPKERVKKDKRKKQVYWDENDPDITVR